ncbi:putative GTP pyrophosphokinase [Ruminococcus sp. YE71]|uniref:GTP pyrophosphokinase n=1 Tax=unclassified Ruminococcus TaxID=2608920 RepID=UPI0008923789|nr:MULTISPECIES: GTP pyrophosphokinase family protein [unclassified Ruminococcus]SDA16832.1 putative GTP pyrophosphokinase [Ruminococcus sp. YE78]SFW25688.1 putative GTP pyrophosphokinase [Ruminococcus sp. YE71]
MQTENEILTEETETAEYPLMVFQNEEFERTRLFFEQFNRMMTYYKCAMMEIETKFNVLNEAFSHTLDRNPINSVHCRLKSPESIRAKLEKKGCKMSMNAIEANLNDIAGIRVTCPFIEDVYLLAGALLNQDDITLLEAKDYIKNPKPNGYRSLHLIVIVPIFLPAEKQYVKVEIQIRTIAMDFWAALEHQLKYKKSYEYNEEMANELYLCAEISANLDARMDRLRRSVLGDRPIENGEL